MMASICSRARRPSPSPKRAARPRLSCRRTPSASFPSRQGCSEAWRRAGTRASTSCRNWSRAAELQIRRSVMQPRSNQHPRDPGEQYRYDPQRDRSPSIAARFGRADCHYSLWRQHEPIARDVVDLIEQRAGTRQQARQLTEETADLAGSLDRILESADRPEIAGDPLAHNRIGCSPHIELGIKRTRNAFDDDHGLLQQQQLGARAHIEQPSNLEEQHQKLGHRDVFGGPIVNWLANGADRLRETLDRMVARYISRIEMHLRGTLIVARDEPK